MKFALAIVAPLLASLPVVCAAQVNEAADAAIVAEATKGTLKALGGEYFDRDYDASVAYQAEVKDLNGDGQPEVFTKRYGGMFGMAGVEVQLYVKDKSGQWIPQFGFPGDYRILEAKAGTYPDIEIQGPGTCFPVWRWNGSAYAIHKRCAPVEVGPTRRSGETPGTTGSDLVACRNRFLRLIFSGSVPRGSSGIYAGGRDAMSKVLESRHGFLPHGL